MFFYFCWLLSKIGLAFDTGFVFVLYLLPVVEISLARDRVLVLITQVQLDSVMSDGDGDGDSSGFKDDDLSTEPDEDEYREQTDVEYAESLTSPIENAVGPIFSWKDGHKLYDENDAKLAVFDVAMPTKMKERLRHIIDEMINTEHEYVKSLEYILEHYLPLMESTQLPPTLIGQKNVIFGNIERICDFHKRFDSVMFLIDLMCAHACICCV